MLGAPWLTNADFFGSKLSFKTFGSEIAPGVPQEIVAIESKQNMLFMQLTNEQNIKV